jgi:hypothetical protein
MKLSRQSFEKYASVKFYVKSIRKEPRYSMPMDRHTGGHDEVYNRFSQIFEHAQKLSDRYLNLSMKVIYFPT